MMNLVLAISKSALSLEWRLSMYSSRFSKCHFPPWLSL